MRKIGKMLKDAIGREEILRAARAQSALRSWSDIVGPTLAGKSTPDRYERGTVWISVQGSAWAQELRLIKPQVLTKLCEAAGEAQLFQDLRFGVRPASTGRFEPIPEPEPPPERPQIDPDLTIRDIANKRMATWPNEERTRS